MESKGSVFEHAGRKIFTQDFTLVLLSFFALIAANHALIPTLPIYVTQLGSSEREVGVLVGIMGVAALITRFFIGGVLTRCSEKRVMIFGAALFSLTFPAAIVLQPFWPLIAVRIFQGIAFASFHTAAMAYTINVISPTYRGQGIAYFMLAPNFAMAVAAPSGVFLADQYGFSIFFLACAVSSACSLLLSFGVKERSMVKTLNQSTLLRSAFVIEWKIVVPAIASFMQMFIFGALIAFVPLYALQRGVTNPGVFFTASAIVIIIGRVFGGKILDTYDKEKIVLSFIVVSAVSLILLSFSRTLPMFVLVGLLSGAGAAFFQPACTAYAFEYAGSTSGAAVATYQAFMDLGMALGPVIMGLIIPLTGYPVMFLTLAFICLVDYVYFQFYVRKGHNARPPIV